MNYTESSSGLFLAASLATPTKTSEHPLQSPVSQLHGGRSTPATPALANSRSGIFSPPPSQSDMGSIDMMEEQPEEFPKEDLLLPYQRFLTAVLSSINFNLSLHSGYTPLNICTLVSPSSLPTRTREGNDGEDLLPSAPITALDVIRPAVLVLEAYLTTSGTFLVTPHTHVQPAIRRMSSTPLLNSLDERDAFIAPWGQWGRIVPSDQDLRIGAREERWKSYVREYLEDCGILSMSGRGWGERSPLEKAINCGKWRRLEIWVPFMHLPTEGMLVKILWPEALLFLRTSEDDVDFVPPMAGETATTNSGDPFWRKVFDDPEYARYASGRLARSLAPGAMDRREMGVEWWDISSALDFAEEWMKGKEERDKIIASKREEAEKRRQEEEKAGKKAGDTELQQDDDHMAYLASLDDDEDDDDNEGIEESSLKFMDETKKAELFIVAEGAGMYPTPPDGGQQAQQLGSSSISPGSASNPATANTAATTVSTEMDLDWMDGSIITDSITDPIRKQSDAIGELGLGGGTGEADIFGGDMDAEEMFARGITEDDFAFFDNPDELGGFGSGEGDVDMGLDADFQSQSGMDMNMESPQIPSKDDVLGLVTTPAQNQTREPHQEGLKSSMEDSADGKPEPHIQTPPLSPYRFFRLLVPEYADSPKKNSHHLTPPTTAPVMKTPQRNGVPASLSGGLSESRRRASLYSPITFAAKMEMADRKYAPGGRFFLPESTKEKEEKEFDKENATTLGLKRKRGGGMFMRSMVVAETAAPEVTEVVLPDEDAAMDDSDGGDGEDSEFRFGGDTSSESDADDETEEEEEEPGGGAYYTSPREVAYGGGSLRRKRKRQYEDEDQEMEQSPTIADAMERDVGGEEPEATGEMAPPPWDVMVPDPTESSLVGIFSKMTLEAEAVSLAGLVESELVAVSRLVRDQVVYGTTKPMGNLVDMGGAETVVENDNEENCLLRLRRRNDEAAVEEAVKSFFGKAGVARCNLGTYVAVADAVIEPPPLLGRAAGMRPIPQPRRGGIAPGLAKRPETEPSMGVFKLDPPHVHIHRAESALEILPPALQFWETFGFAPCSGAKNVIAFCLYPSSGSLEEAADAFLERISGAYESGRYGAHVRAKLDDIVENGGWGIKERGIKGVVDAMEEFGSVLANVGDEGCNIVIYVVNPFEHPSSLVDVCVGFARMKKVYEMALGGLKGNNLVLQVIPVGFIANKIGLAAAGPSLWARLAAEVYNRSVLSDGVDSLEEVCWALFSDGKRNYANHIIQAQKTFSPSIYLARPPPKSIEFKLTTEPSPALFYENSVLHVAYSQSLDERWVSVGWTDNCGEVQSTEIYCLGRKNTTILRPFDEVCRDIWNKTLEIIAYRRVHWRLMVVKVGQELLSDEIDIWTQLCSTSIHSLAIFSADVDSPVYLAPNLHPLFPSSFSHQTSVYTTPPVTTPTPGPSIVSPDQFGNAANTPTADPLPELDPDSNLVDFTDETWGVICAHRKRIPTPANPDGGGGLLGYLIKRGGTEESDELAILRLELLVADGRGGGKPLLREVLGWYRDLITLAQFKGVIEVEGKGSVYPWHIAVAWKGVEAVGYVM